jgi:hypothetical protein
MKSNSIFNLILNDINDLLESNFIDKFKNIEPDHIKKFLQSKSILSTNTNYELLYKCIKSDTDFDYLQNVSIPHDKSDTNPREVFLLCLGPQTFIEIISLFPQEVLFPDMHDLGDFLVKIDAQNVTISSQLYSIVYESYDCLKSDIIELGIIEESFNLTDEINFPVRISLEVIQARYQIISNKDFNVRANKLFSEKEIPFLD